MVCSHAQVEANRRNALMSKGPTSPEGKAKSRANSYKHGLTGAGVVVPTEDLEEVDRRFAALEAEMKPCGELARGLVSRIAVLMLKLERSSEHEAKAIAHKMRKAEAEFVDAKLAEMENYYSWIAAEPATNARRLRSSLEGIHRLLSVMQDLRDDLAHPEGHRWDWQRCEQLHHMLGLRPCDVPFSRARALSDAIEGNFRNLNLADGGDLDIPARKQWAETALVDLIDQEIGKLEALQANFDHEALALDRAEAMHRAIFDPSPAATLARKYESAIERGLYRAIKEFRELQPLPPQVVIEEAVAPDSIEETGSFLPESMGEESEIVDVDSIDLTVPSPPARSGQSRVDPSKKGRSRGHRRRN